MTTEQNNNGTVMIVDDTPGNLALLSDTLTDADYRVLVATDGQTAIEQMHYFKPDIILLDVMMPGIDGFETCRRLKADPETAHIPILFMTGLSELDDLLRGFGEGAQDYIVKPIRPPEVLARIEVHLTQSRTVLRAQRAIVQIGLSALSINTANRIVWLTPLAQNWLEEYAKAHNLLKTPQLTELLPLPLAQWALQTAQTTPDNPSDYSDTLGFSAKMNFCPHSNEHLILLQKSSSALDLDLLRSSFGLTIREAEILMWISRGKTNKEIGTILDTSPRTVNKHLEHIFEKLGVYSRTAAVSKAMQQNNSPH